ncbi:MAG: hypothetical protein WCE52_12415, partial [Candidatus Acidiferrum sp.]
MTLKVVGDAKQGYGVTVLYNAEPLARHNQGGEFSGVFQNEDRSLEDHVDNWKASSWSGTDVHLTLAGECLLRNLNATVFVKVDYERITSGVIRKRIRIRQSDMFLIFYQLSNRLESLERPEKLWSFDQLDWRGESLHEYFPAAGFRMKNGRCIGLLTDAGYRNQWTRIIRRDGKPVKPAPARIPDANLYSGMSSVERSNKDCFVQQTFGEITYQVSAGSEPQKVALPEISSWKRIGDATLEERDGIA